MIWFRLSTEKDRFQGENKVEGENWCAARVFAARDSGLM